MFTQYIVIYEEWLFFSPVESWIYRFFPQWIGRLTYLKARWSVGNALEIPWETHFRWTQHGNTGEKWWKIKINTKLKGHIFEPGIPFLWHSGSNFDWDITIWVASTIHETTCSSFLLIESWLPYIFGRHFRKHGTISSSGFDWARFPERRQDFRSPYNHFTCGPWTINVFNRQSTVTQYVFFF